jgi:hypothetical protein
MFEKEAKGLELLKSCRFIIPDVIYQGSDNGFSYLIMNYIDNSSGNMNWIKFGEYLAKMHLVTNETFGLDHDNYIGSLEQKNTISDTWFEFYTQQRLMHLTRIAYDKTLLGKKEISMMESICYQLADIIPKENPSLIHGDLWQGNLMSNLSGAPILIDPAIYYGHREMDLGMLQLFGQISTSTINSYNEFYPLEKGWQDRIPIHQLYPLLVHLILFGESYRSAIVSTLNSYN